jgi:peptidoglycan-N-acetylglucosamine deacetylase
VLCGLGLRLASWTRRGFDTRERDAGKVARRLIAGLAPRDILLVHDGHAARGGDGRPVLLDVLPTVLRAAAEAQLQWTTLRGALAAQGTWNEGESPLPAGGHHPPFDKI